ncbi:MAG: TorF family putative porin [Sphingorhabdus sp.]
MRKTVFKLAASIAAYTALAISAPAMAQDEADDSETSAPGPVDVEVTLTAVSDYRFRGVSLSDKDPAFQPGITVTHQSGLYAGVWGSTIAENPGSDIEVDLFAGFSGGDVLTYDIGAVYYLYPGASNFNYVEMVGKLGTTIGPLELGGMVAYVPSQNNTGNQDNVYVATTASAGLPGTPLTINAGIGFEDGAFGNEKIDWTLGVSAEVKGFSLGAAYVDTNRNVGGLGRAGAIFSISYTF